jgi:hypothetical protein
MGNVWMVRGGQMPLRFTNNWRTVSSAIGLVGTGWIYWGSAGYNAMLNGTLAGSGRWQ